MKKTAPDQVIQSLIQAIRDNLGEAHAVAKEANKRARRGRPRQALKLLMDFEGPSHDAHDLFKAALNIKRHRLAEPD
jgi:hypothetical protein